MQLGAGFDDVKKDKSDSSRPPGEWGLGLVGGRMAFSMTAPEVPGSPHSSYGTLTPATDSAHANPPSQEVQRAQIWFAATSGFKVSRFPLEKLRYRDGCSQYERRR